MSEDIDVLLQEHRKFPPPPSFRSGAHVSDDVLYRTAGQNPEAFWEAQAANLEWIRKWDTVLDWKPPHATWFNGGWLRRISSPFTS